MLNLMKKINYQKLWFFGMAVGALLLALPLAADEDKSKAAERSSSASDNLGSLDFSMIFVSFKK